MFFHKEKLMGLISQNLLRHRSITATSVIGVILDDLQYSGVIHQK